LRSNHTNSQGRGGPSSDFAPPRRKTCGHYFFPISTRFCAAEGRNVAFCSREEILHNNFKKRKKKRKKRKRRKEKKRKKEEKKKKEKKNMND
jgi:hypothetical protein